jgi:hypothetical protein
VLSQNGRPASNGPGPAVNGTTPLNGWARLVGVVGIPGAIAFYLVWWVTKSLGERLDRIIQLLDEIARTVKVAGP